MTVAYVDLGQDAPEHMQRSARRWNLCPLIRDAWAVLYPELPLTFGGEWTLASLIDAGLRGEVAEVEARFADCLAGHGIVSGSPPALTDEGELFAVAVLLLGSRR